MSDGDTFTGLKADKTQVKIRLHGVDCPESGQDFGARAKQRSYRCPDYSTRVVGVSDGDTFTGLKADKTQVKIRLHGVDCPESGQDFGARAKQDTSSLALGQTVTIRPRDTDRYGRTVAEVILPDGESLTRILVHRGHAYYRSQNCILKMSRLF